MPSKLKIDRSFRLPLAEVSGLCIRRTARGLELVAVGDRARAVVTAPVGGPDVIGPPERRDIGALFPAARQGSQWEAVAADATGQIFVLEEAGRIHVIAPDFSALRATIALDLSADPALSRAWQADESSRAEGLVLLRGGRALLVKEKRPPRLIEVGPRGDRAAGVAPDLLAPDAFPVPAGPNPALVPLRTWAIERGEELSDLSDAAVGPDGALYLLSDQDRCLVRIDPRLPAEGGAARVVGRWELHKKVKKPEGLAILDSGAPLVAVDRAEDEQNLFLLERPD